MHPVLITFNLLGKDILIGTYGVLMVAGFAAAAAISILRARRYGYRPGDFFNYLALVGAGVVGGALLAGFLLFLPERIEHRFVDYPPAFVSWGGILGGVAALAFAASQWKRSFLELADIITPGYLVGLGIGRIGCFFAGCCYGVHTTSCIGIAFSDPAAPAAAMQQPLVPTQLISALFLVSAGMALLCGRLRTLNSGALFSISAIVYSLSRFTIELWRDDPRVFLRGLSDGQLFSIAYLAFGIGVLVYGYKEANQGPTGTLKGPRTMRMPEQIQFSGIIYRS